MYEKERKQLQQQLQLQASYMASVEGSPELILSITGTCLALLRTAEKMFPEKPDEQDLTDFNMGYLGIRSRVDNFYNCYAPALRAEYQAREQGQEAKNKALSQQLMDRESQIQVLQARQKELGDSLRKAGQSLDSETRKVREQEAELEDCRRRLQKTREAYQGGARELLQLQQTAQKLQKAQEDLQACQQWLPDFKASVAREGFADLAAFRKALEQQDRLADQAIQGYRGVICRLIEEMDTRKEELQARQDPAYTERHETESV